jgi:hypothetical protein
MNVQKRTVDYGFSVKRETGAASEDGAAVGNQVR